ncbi:MAG: hypothetical protein M3134_09440 [Actinomycetota bacterium]|nr:hypothetical protein [Actinomycetota bacterium]
MRVRERSALVVAAAVAAALVLGACSSPAQSYEDVDALAAAVSEAGVECSVVDRGPSAQLVNEVASCEGSGATLYVFDSLDRLEEWKAVAGRLGPVVTGPNWAVVADTPTVRQLAETLHAETT